MRWCVTALVAGVVLALLALRPAHGQPEPAARVAVGVTAGQGVPGWAAAALARTLAADLGADERIAVSSSEPDVRLAAVLLPERLVYEVHAAWLGESSRVARGAIAIAGLTRAQLSQGVSRALDPVVRPGGLLDRRATARAPAALPAAGNGALAWLVVFGLALILLAPVGAGALAAGVGAALRTRAFERTVAILLGLAVVAYGLSAAPDRLQAWSWAIYLGGGLAWGWLVAVTVPVVFPSFQGFERVEPFEVFPLLRVWVLVALQRLARASLYHAPPALAAWWIAAALGMPAGVTVALVLPVTGLLTRFWLLSLVENLALGIDRRLLAGPASADDPWHRAVHGYVMGYVRRAGWAADPALLDRVRFLPGEGEGIVQYGGGLTHSRVVIGRGLLEFALAPYDRPHDYAPRRDDKLLWTEWNAGLVVPAEPDAPVATAADRSPRHAPLPGETAYQPLGEARTLAGYVEPDALDKRPSRRPYEDPAWLDWDPGEEHDGTDASDKDLLFGALVRALGAHQRGDDGLATIGLALRSGPAPVARVAARAGAVLAGGFGRHPAMLADAYPALNHARHHLVQYLGWQTFRRDDLLTARAPAPALEHQTSTILGALEAAGDRPGRGVTPRARLGWLAALSRTRVRSRRAVRARRLIWAALAAAGTGALAVGVWRAVDYHPVYLDRLQQQPDVAPAPTPPTDRGSSGHAPSNEKD